MLNDQVGPGPGPFDPPWPSACSSCSRRRAIACSRLRLTRTPARRRGFVRASAPRGEQALKAQHAHRQCHEGCGHQAAPPRRAPRAVRVMAKARRAAPLLHSTSTALWPYMALHHEECHCQHPQEAWLSSAARCAARSRRAVRRWPARYVFLPMQQRQQREEDEGEESTSVMR